MFLRALRPCSQDPGAGLSGTVMLTPVAAGGEGASPPQGTWRQRMSEKLEGNWASGGQFEEGQGSPHLSAVGRGQFSGGGPLSVSYRGSSTG